MRRTGREFIFSGLPAKAFSGLRRVFVGLYGALWDTVGT